MFERYTEPARRVMFYARYEASQTGSAYIECDHLVLGMLHENTSVRQQLDPGERDRIRQEIIKPFAGHEKLPTTVDLPLSQDAKLALAYAAETAARISSNHINTSHLFAGLVRVGGRAVELLVEHGVEVVPEPAPPPAEEGNPVTPATALAPSLVPIVDRLNEIVDRTLAHVDRSANAGEQRLKRKAWTRKQAMGHLIDWAMMHQQVFARALTESNVNMPMYPQESWVDAEGYAEFPWFWLVRTWATLNRFLARVIGRVPVERLIVPCRVGVHAPVPLAKIIEAYVDHCEDIAGQVLLHDQ